ncbi:MAG: hypothetical protein HQ546_00735 [Planctomycetes bacterium]|nr:hypothetical protein [Planctomycetota bacterium]
MNNQTRCETCHGVIVPESTLLKVEQKDKYGSVPWLDDDELADVDELERQIIRAEWGPILRLHVVGRKDSLRPDVDEDGFAVGAFGSIDFDRIKSGFDKGRYKADKLREERKDVLIRFSVIRERLQHKDVGLVLKRIRDGRIEVDDIADFDMWWLAKFYLRAERLRKQIAELDEASWSRKQRAHQAWLGSLC